RIHTDSVAPANGISQYDPAVAHDPRDLPGCVHLAGQFDRGRDDRWRVFTPSPYGKTTTAMQVVTVLAVLYVNWRNITVPELNILFYMTGFMTAFSGLHYLIRALRRWPFNE